MSTGSIHRRLARSHETAFDIQGQHAYFVLMDVFRILFNILLFTTSLFAAALFVEKIYAGRWKWVAFGLLTGFILVFSLSPGTLISVLEALPGELSPANAATLVLGGVAAGFLSTGV
jgi:hypothetical protein